MAREPIKSVEEKFSIVLEGLKENTNIAELCRRHGMSRLNHIPQVRAIHIPHRGNSATVLKY